MQITLRPHQIECSIKGLGLLHQYNICYLAMEVRTGKTITAMEIASKFFAQNVLFITKKKAINSIRSDYNLFATGFNITVINYESLHTIPQAGYDLVIIDEAHKIGAYPKEGKAQIQIKKICKGLPIIFLSGTPTPESYSQIFHQLGVSSFSPFNEYKNFYGWANDFVDVRKKYVYNREINDYSHAYEERIKSKINHLFVSYTQAQAGFNQEVREEILKVKMKPITYKFVETLLRDRIVITKTGHEIIADTAVKMLSKLHQIYSGTVINEMGENVMFDGSKALFIKEYFKGQKIAIYYKFDGERKLLEKVFDTTRSPEEFRTSDKVFISQFISGREGVNLASADALIMYNIDFSSLSRLQTLGRLQDKDREKEAVIYWVFAEGGIEEKIYQAVKAKQDYTSYYFKKDFHVTTKPDKQGLAV